MERHPVLLKNYFLCYVSLNSLIQKAWDNDRETCLIDASKS